MGVILGPDGTPIQSLDPFVEAVMKLLQGTGCNNFNVMTLPVAGYPPVSAACAYWRLAPPIGLRWETASGRTPREAVFRLMERIAMDSTCGNCNKPVWLRPLPVETWSDFKPDPSDEACSLVYDLETNLIRRACDGA